MDETKRIVLGITTTLSHLILLKEWISCVRCGDSGSAEPTIAYPEGSPCECRAEDKIEYVIAHFSDYPLAIEIPQAGDGEVPF